jgi:hypothetical protein
MSSSDQYHKYARECVVSAAQAKTEIERQTYLDMAHTWARAALEAQQSAPLYEKRGVE